MLSGIICESLSSNCAKRLDISLNEYRLIVGKYGVTAFVQCFDCPLKVGEKVLETTDRYQIVERDNTQRK